MEHHRLLIVFHLLLGLISVEIEPPGPREVGRRALPFVAVAASRSAEMARTP